MTNPSCTKCNSEETVVMNKWQYFFFLSTLPIIVSLIFSYIFHPILLTFILFVFVVNMRIAKKKTPYVICRNCKQVQQGSGNKTLRS
ncbi:hypothetical protein [Alkalihalobacterium chitinilyticum]|uniref:LITAF domain-containing protein n=1 Tax=Alkalihalobacterium chitinilyticum TaxID=2980103 RepID=A0ABT5VHB5_9BACI|nr:hypothetical protein [Alkalihalobacterium chitinilyticum]MDE5414722.1 hypothetical protein [Alkalihalobacterium chitinilyticum]